VVEDQACLWLKEKVKFCWMLEIIWPGEMRSSRLGEELESMIAQMHYNGSRLARYSVRALGC
jgi:hypothetical protein